jgi:RTX calcium-binding nonapeptide repeat (4 copies)
MISRDLNQEYEDYSNPNEFNAPDSLSYGPIKRANEFNAEGSLNYGPTLAGAGVPVQSAAAAVGEKLASIGEVSAKISENSAPILAAIAKSSVAIPQMATAATVAAVPASAFKPDLTAYLVQKQAEFKPTRVGGTADEVIGSGDSGQFIPGTPEYDSSFDTDQAKSNYYKELAASRAPITSAAGRGVQDFYGEGERKTGSNYDELAKQIGFAGPVRETTGYEYNPGQYMQGENSSGVMGQGYETSTGMSYDFKTALKDYKFVPKNDRGAPAVDIYDPSGKLILSQRTQELPQGMEKYGPMIAMAAITIMSAGTAGPAMAGLLGIGEGALSAVELAALGELGINTTALGLGAAGNAALGNALISAVEQVATTGKLDLKSLATSALVSTFTPMANNFLSETLSPNITNVLGDSKYAKILTDSVSKSLVTGAVTEIKGGDFSDGFQGAFVGSLVTAGTGALTNLVSDTVLSTATDAGLDLTGALAKAGTSAVVAGTTAAITGKGDFSTAFTSSLLGSATNLAVNTVTSTVDGLFTQVTDALGGTKKDKEIATLSDTGNGISADLVSDVKSGDIVAEAGKTTTDTLVGTDTISAGTDTLVGAAGTDTVAGAAGTDTLVGAAGTDTLAGTLATDTLAGGADTLAGAAVTSGLDTTLGALGTDTLLGGALTDTTADQLVTELGGGLDVPAVAPTGGLTSLATTDTVTGGLSTLANGDTQVVGGLTTVQQAEAATAKAAADQIAADQAVADALTKADAEKAAADKLAADQAVADAASAAEAAKVAEATRIENERLAKIETDRLAKIEADRLAKIESDRLAKESAEGEVLRAKNEQQAAIDAAKEQADAIAAEKVAAEKEAAIEAAKVAAQNEAQALADANRITASNLVSANADVVEGAQTTNQVVGDRTAGPVGGLTALAGNNPLSTIGSTLMNKVLRPAVKTVTSGAVKNLASRVTGGKPAAMPSLARSLSGNAMSALKSAATSAVAPQKAAPKLTAVAKPVPKKMDVSKLTPISNIANLTSLLKGKG